MSSPAVLDLVRKGANVRAADSKGRTPLHFAACRGDANMGGWVCLCACVSVCVCGVQCVGVLILVLTKQEVLLHVLVMGHCLISRSEATHILWWDCQPERLHREHSPTPG